MQPILYEMTRKQIICIIDVFYCIMYHLLQTINQGRVFQYVRSTILVCTQFVLFTSSTILLQRRLKLAFRDAQSKVTHTVIVDRTQKIALESNVNASYAEYIALLCLAINAFIVAACISI